METVQGIPVFPGVAICPAFVLDREGFRIPKHTIAPDAVLQEVARLDQCLVEVTDDLARSAKAVEEKLGPEVAGIFAAHKLLVGDPNLRRKIVGVVETTHVNVEQAVHQVLEQYANVFRSMRSQHFADRGADVADIERRILGKLVGDRLHALHGVDHQVAVLAHDLTPTETAGFNPKLIRGIVTETGGQTSHTAIIAGAMQIPAIVGVGSLPPVTDGDTVIIDGDRGVMIVSPDEPTLQKYHAYVRDGVQRERRWDSLRDLPADTTDGKHVTLLGNIEFPHEAQACLDKGAEGIGLYRTEFLFLAKDEPPTEDEQYEAYAEVLRIMGPDRPVTFRTLDLGADKVERGSKRKPEANPFLGLRSIRLSLKNRPLFETQLRAMLRASVLGDLRIMFPLVTTLRELRQAKLILREVMEDLEEDGVPFNPKIKVGMMVEVPASAVLAPSFADYVDFFSIGTNDLIQYTLAVDRTNEVVAPLYSASDPAVLRLIYHCVRAALEKGKSVSVCGEMSGDPMYVQYLLGIGVTHLSCAPHNIPSVKQEIRRTNMAQARKVVKRVQRIESAPAVTKYLRSCMPDHQIADNRPWGDATVAQVKQ
jgi:phosphotransferase system enzyme I (PtsI)